MKMSVGQHLQFQKMKPSTKQTETILWWCSSTQAMLGKWMYRFIGGLVCWPSIRMSSLHGQSILRLVSCTSWILNGMQSVLWTTLHVLWGLLHPFVWTSGQWCKIVKPIHAESIAWTWRAPKEANSCYGNTVAQRSLFGAGQTFELSSNSTTSSILKALKLGWELSKFLEKIVCWWIHLIKTSSFLMVPTQQIQRSCIRFQSQIGSSEIQWNKEPTKTNIRQLTLELGFLPIWQSNWPPTQRSPMAPPKPSWAGGDLAMTPLSWKPWSKRSKEPWKHFTGFFRTSWMNCFFQMYHWMLF